MMNAATAVSDRETIAATIQQYIDGGISGRSDEMKPAFHEGARLRSNIAAIDIEGSIATVRLELDNWTGHKFTDMFTMLKTDGEWKIISKVFYLHPED